LGVRRAAIKIVHGVSGRRKTVHVSGVAQAAVDQLVGRS
jgi:uncharacterized protein YggU (UPF0235/DUF167 family)